MGECLIARGGIDAAIGGKNGIHIKTECIIENTIWEVPGNCLIDRGIAVRIFGGGGAMNSGGGGGGGWMNNAIFNNLIKYEQIQIVIGNGGSYSAGGTTFFGKYLSANGGTQGFNGSGGSGGSGGGGGTYIFGNYYYTAKGGDGHQFGGGGSSGFGIRSNFVGIPRKGGNGGKWGGGGGASFKSSDIGIGGELGGNGGNNTLAPENGTIAIEFKNANRNIFGNDIIFTEYNALPGGQYGGGGGYGGCGGISSEKIINTFAGSYTYYSGGGGGGGYGANGGNSSSVHSLYGVGGGGGGGFGGKGADCGDGGFNWNGGGGGGYGAANYGCGGGGLSSNGQYGKHGICVIQYYVKD